MKTSNNKAYKTDRSILRADDDVVTTWAEDGAPDWISKLYVPDCLGVTCLPELDSFVETCAHEVLRLHWVESHGSDPISVVDQR